MSPHSTSGPFDGPPSSSHRKDSNTSPIILIRNLAKSLDSAALESMMLFAQGLTSVDFVSNPADDHKFKTAMARFSSSSAAQEAKTMLDGKWNSSKDAHLLVNYVPLSPGGSAAIRRLIDGASPDGHISGRSTKFNGSFSPFDQVSPTMPTTGFSPNEPLTRSESFSIFPPTGPLGSPLERQRVSGKSMISEDGADDETGKLINDPVAFAKNDMANATQARRSTMPQLPINRLANLSISSPTGSNGVSGLLSPRGVQSPSTYSNHGMNTPTNVYAHNMQYPRTNMPPVNPADQNPPCNTLYVGNLPQDTAEDELKLLFSKQRGYKRLCFRVKQQGPMCFVEFEDVTFATKTLHELYGHMLSNSVKGGIRLSFSKNPLGVRANQPNGLASPLSPQGGLGGMSYGNMAAFAAASGPPPGLSMPSPYVPMSPIHNGAFANYNPVSQVGNAFGPISPSATSGLSSRSPAGLSGGPWGPTNGDYQYGRPLYG